MTMIQVTVDCSTGQVSSAPMTPAQEAQRIAEAQTEAAAVQVGQTRRQAARTRLAAKVQTDPAFQALVDLFGIDLTATG